MNRILSVTTGARDTAVAVLSTVKSELSLVNFEQDEKLNRLIAATGRSFGAVLGRALWYQTHSEELPGLGGNFLRLHNWPVDYVSSVIDIDGDTIAATDYEIAGKRRDRLHRADNGMWAAPHMKGLIHLDRQLDYTVTYAAGWVMPGDIETWKASEPYGAIGQKHWVRAVDGSVVVRFEATTAGTSDVSEPTWDTTVGNTTTDGSVTWTTREAEELPEDIQEVAIGTVVNWFRSSPAALPAGLLEVRLESAAVRYDPSSSGFGGLPKYAQAVLGQYR